MLNKKATSFRAEPLSVNGIDKIVSFVVSLNSNLPKSRSKSCDLLF